MPTSTIMITTPRGLEKLLTAEVKALGMPVTWAGTSGVKTTGTLFDAMKLNLYLRTGHRVLLRLDAFACRTPDDLYVRAIAFPWETIIAADGYVSVASNVVNTTIRDTRFPNLRLKDAIVDRIYRKKGRRPDAGPDRHRAVVSLFWRNERCELYLDTSGEPLSKRGYRKIPLHAPMQETLAAGVIMTAGWTGANNFVNPMCGSGTLAIEAALIATNRAPGLVRPQFAFMHTLLFNKEAWAKLRSDARQAVKPFTGRIIATDIDPAAVDATMANARTAGVERMIECSAGDFADTPVPPGCGIVMINPEYGLRLGEDKNLVPTYRGIGDFLKKKCQGYTGYVFTANSELAGKVGLKSGRKFNFQSGDLECRLYEYDILPSRHKVG
jgi:putative N6-adenine-specific DNA methylase